MKTLIDTIQAVFSACPTWMTEKKEALDEHFFVFGSRVIPSAADASPILMNRNGRLDRVIIAKVCIA